MKKNKLAGVLMAALMSVSAIGAPTVMTKLGVDTPIAIVHNIEASAAYVTTGCFNGDNFSGYTYVYPKNSRKASKIKVCAFRENGKINGGKFTVYVYSSNGAFVKSQNISGSGYVTLNSGYSGYKIRTKRNNPWGRSAAADNRAKTVYWSIDRYSNLYY